jgi:hypothetical protein
LHVDVRSGAVARVVTSRERCVTVTCEPLSHGLSRWNMEGPRTTGSGTHVNGSHLGSQLHSTGSAQAVGGSM